MMSQNMASMFAQAMRETLQSKDKQMNFDELPIHVQNEHRELVRGQFTTELAQLIARAASAGLVITVEQRYAMPLSVPGMVFNVRHARGHYLKEK